MPPTAKGTRDGNQLERMYAVGFEVPPLGICLKTRKMKTKIRYCKGVGSWRTTSATTTSSRGREGDFAVHASVYRKVQAEPTVNPNVQDRRKGEERCLFLPLLGCLATYVGCVLCASLSRLGGQRADLSLEISTCYCQMRKPTKGRQKEYLSKNKCIIP